MIASNTYRAFKASAKACRKLVNTYLSQNESLKSVRPNKGLVLLFGFPLSQWMHVQNEYCDPYTLEPPSIPNPSSSKKLRGAPESSELRDDLDLQKEWKNVESIYPSTWERFAIRNELATKYFNMQRVKSGNFHFSTLSWIKMNVSPMWNWLWVICCSWMMTTKFSIQIYFRNYYMSARAFLLIARAFESVQSNVVDSLECFSISLFWLRKTHKKMKK